MVVGCWLLASPCLAAWFLGALVAWVDCFLLLPCCFLVASLLLPCCFLVARTLLAACLFAFACLFGCWLACSGFACWFVCLLACLRLILCLPFVCCYSFLFVFFLVLRFLNLRCYPAFCLATKYLIIGVRKNFCWQLLLCGTLVRSWKKFGGRKTTFWQRKKYRQHKKYGSALETFFGVQETFLREQKISKRKSFLQQRKFP